MANLSPSHRNSVVVGALLRSRFSEYLVESVLGQGTFGTVAKCRRIADRKTVAIKMMKNQNQLAKAEVAVLSKLRCLDSDKCNLVRWHRSFLSNDHICLEFEHLDKSLYDFMVGRNGQPLHIKEIRPIVQQLANALDHLKTAGIIHADLKLENIMLVNHAQEPFRVKVIDFGLASDVSAAKLGSYLQSLPYRSPEIILGLPFTEVIDMWSLGIIAAALYLGFFPFPGSNDYDMMRCIVEVIGQPPNTMLTLGSKTGRYFQQDHDTTNSTWTLKAPEQFWKESGIQSKETRALKLRSLYDLLHIRAIGGETMADRGAESCDMLDFVDLLIRMLHLEAAKRITPRQVLKHQFTSMCNMGWMYHLSSYVRSSSELLNPTTESRKAVCGSLQQPSSATTHPIQQNLPSASAERSQYSGKRMQASTAVSTPLAQAQRSNTDTSSSYSLKRKRDDSGSRGQRKKVKSDPAPPTSSSNTLTLASSSSYSLKRKRDDSDSRGQRKRVKSDPAPPTTSSKALTLASSSSYSLKRKRDDSDSRGQRKKVKGDPAPPTSSSKALTDEPDKRSVPAESRAQSGRKRKSHDVEYVGHQRGDNRN
ncbi:hypothetical protein VZT92_008207 [Zoarces viviparus]|uniref:Protein kinase domain-containing protein n=1 Tax=Zoarces viviparus TaxID=48416 RepID=A0AAW1FM28_ZOAVI